MTPNPRGAEEAARRLLLEACHAGTSERLSADITLVLSAYDTAQREREEALKLLLTRYVTPDLVKLVGQAMKDIADANEMVSRLRGEADQNADLKRFIHYVDHEHHMSRGEVSLIIDFAQGQIARAERAEQALAERETYHSNNAAAWQEEIAELHTDLLDAAEDRDAAQAALAECLVALNDVLGLFAANGWLCCDGDLQVAEVGGAREVYARLVAASTHRRGDQGLSVLQPAAFALGSTSMQGSAEPERAP